MHILKVRCRNSAEFAEQYQPELPNGGMFCPTTTPLESGEDVIVELSAPNLPNKVLIRGSVKTWRPALPRLRLRAGAVVEFNGDENTKRDFIVETIAGKRGPSPRRRHTRLPLQIPVRYRTTENPVFVDGGLTEISVGGGMLSTTDPLPLGTDVVLEILPPGAVMPLPISGRVTYHGPAGGTGLKFIYRDAGGSRRLRELVRRLRLS
jgi:Tfp pilus assembly protein PilZ